MNNNRKDEIKMASATPMYNKNEELTGYRIKVSRGYDANGKQLTPYSTVWKLPEDWDKWAKKRQQKELDIAKAKFQATCDRGEVKTRAEIKAEKLEQSRLKAEMEAENAKKMLFADGFEFYMSKTKSKKKINTITGIRTTMKRALKWFKSKKLEDISEEDCQAYIDFLLCDCDLRISTVRKHYATLSAFLTWCVKQNLIASNLMKNIEKPVDNEGEEKVETFSVEELKKILLCSEKEPLMWQTMIYLLSDTGMRRGEACGLRWADIDFTNGRIHIVNNAQYTEGKGVYDTKTKNKKERDVYANPQVIEILKKWKALQKEVVEGQNLPTPKHIFTHLDGKRINPQAPTAYLRKFGEKYGIEDCHPHKFRHTMATLMIQNGADIKTVSGKLGHRSIEITLSLYCHSNKDAQQAANEKFASLVWNG